MKRLNHAYRLTGLCVLVLTLHGCAAATVVRTPPDFDEENRQRLMQTFQPETVASLPIEWSTRTD